MSWQGKTILITGAGGFIGSHLTERMVALGANVRALVHYNALGSWGWLDTSDVRASVTVIAGDIRDRDSVRQAVGEATVVFHLAALIAIPYSYQAPQSYVETNVMGTLNVLQAARERGVERVIHTSTSEVYGTAKYTPIDEKHPLQGQSPYSASKIGADKMAEAFHLSFNVPVVTVRPFNTFGPRQSARAVIPTIITQCLAGQKVRLGNLAPLRDLNFVANTVDGFVATAALENTKPLGQTINLGSGREISIGDLAKLIAQLAGKPLDIEADQQRQRPDASEVMRLLADNTLAAELLGWKPAIGLEEGLLRTIKWIDANRERYRTGNYAV